MSTSAALVNWPSEWIDQAVSDCPNSGGDNRSGLRFPLSLPVRYITRGDAGWGEILNISSSGALFTTEHPLPVRASAKLYIKWPVLLSDSVHLNLVASGRIVRVEPGRAAIRIKRHEFRTCSPTFFGKARGLERVTRRS